MKTICETQVPKFDPNPMHRLTLAYSASYADIYLGQHQIREEGLTSEGTKYLACARLEWLLQYVRPQLSGLWTEKEFSTMLNCFRSDLFYPDLYRKLISMICDDLGIDPHDWQSSPIKSLVSSLLELDAGQMLALTDALEQTWHRGLNKGMSTPEFLLTLGIELRSEET